MMSFVGRKIYFKVDLRTLIISILIVVYSLGCHRAWRVHNPYAEVEWQRFGQYKANLHTHTMVSDGWMNPQTVVEKYRQLDYHILAITDHVAVTYPWEEFSKFQASEKTKKRIREKQIKPEETEPIPPEDLLFKDVDSAESGIVDIQGNEIWFKGHELNSFFNDYNGTPSDSTLDTIAAKGGLLVFNHPGRYKLPVSWYIDFYRHYDHLIGIEVFNCGNRYPTDKQLWDSLLTILSPVRPVWGFSNDDMHSMRDMGRNWNVFVLPELNDQWVRRAMEEGLFYFYNAPKGQKGLQYPAIESIDVDCKKGTITVKATATDSILWICEGKKIGKGAQFWLQALPIKNTYVRAELYGAGQSLVCTQPFFIKR